MTATISISATAHVQAYLETRVIRAQPWYKRSIKILWQDLLARVKKPIQRWRRYREIARRRALSQQKSSTKTAENIYFDDPEFIDRPAFDLLREYLNKLEKIVDSAEVQFNSN